MRDLVVERVRSATDIVEVVSAVVELRRSGANLKGLCPFHQEKTPSFTVSPERQVYHCFGCGAGGDVFNFVMKIEGLSFPEALRHLAERAGIPIPRHDGHGSGEALYEILEEAQAHFRRSLAAPRGSAAREYLEGRKLSCDLWDRYGVGFAPEGWRHLTDALARRFSLEDLVRAGVVVRSERGGRAYDRFRNRITFPVSRPGGRIVGFGARALGGEEPKYLNSPDGPLYRKGELLFGLVQAREAIRRQGHGILVEGYFDVLSLAQAQVDGSVAPCGTALTREQAGVLRRNSTRWVLFFDADAAGRKAIWRALPHLLALDLEVRIASAPAGRDPDEVARDEGPEGLKRILDAAADPIAWLMQLAPGEERRGWLVDRVAALISHLPDPLKRQLWVEEAAERLRLRENALWESVEGRVRSARRGTGVVRSESRESPRERKLSPLELDLILLVVEQPDARGEVARLVAAVPGVRPEVKEFLASVASGPSPPTVSEAVSRLGEECGLGGLTEHLLDPAPGCKSEAFRHDLLRRLRREGLKGELRQVNQSLRSLEAGGAGDPGAVPALLAEIQRLKRELQALF